MPRVITDRLFRSAPSMAAGLALLGAALGSAACTKTLDATSIGQSISQGVEAQLALPVTGVECPPDRAAKAGDTFECTATPVAGGKLTVTVTQKDDQGNISWEVTKTEGLLDLRKAEAAVVEGLKTQAKVDAKVDCGGRWKAIKVGEAFECKAVAAEGQTAVIEVTTTDAEGNINWKVQ